MRKIFRISILADVLFILGMVAIVIGIAIDGDIPLALVVAGAELCIVGFLLTFSDHEESGGGL